MYSRCISHHLCLGDIIYGLLAPLCTLVSEAAGSGKGHVAVCTPHWHPSLAHHPLHTITGTPSLARHHWHTITGTALAFITVIVLMSPILTCIIGFTSFTFTTHIWSDSCELVVSCRYLCL